MIRDQKSQENFVRQLKENYIHLVESNPSLLKQMPELKLMKIDEEEDDQGHKRKASGEFELVRRVTDLDLGNFKINQTLGTFCCI